MTEEKPPFPYANYEKALEEVLKHASKDYWEQYTSINNHQVGVAKTYLWVSAAMLGAYSAAVNYIATYTLKMPSCGAVYGVGAILAALVAFGVCLYALPSRSGYLRIGESWGTFSKMAYDGLTEKKTALYRNVLSVLVDEFDNAASHNLHTNNQRAKLLRLTSWLLIFSFGFAVISSLSFGIENINSTNRAVGIMTNETTSDASGNNTPAGQNQGGADAKPDARPPRGPITGKPQNIITHGETTNSNRVVITGGVEKKNIE